MNWIKARREALNMTQERLTARIQSNGYNVSRGTLSHWETGRTAPPLHDPACTNALALALRLSVQSVLEMAGYKTAPLTDKAKLAGELVSQMPDKTQNLAIRILQDLLDEAVV